MGKRTILIDLDGVLNTYKGKYNPNIIEPINKKAVTFLKNLSQKFKVKIFTSRKLTLVEKWIEESNIQQYISDITNIKEPAYLIIDDRCINFDGNYDSTIDKVKSFKPWYKL